MDGRREQLLNEKKKIESLQEALRKKPVPIDPQAKAERASALQKYRSRLNSINCQLDPEKLAHRRCRKAKNDKKHYIKKKETHLPTMDEENSLVPEGGRSGAVQQRAVFQHRQANSGKIPSGSSQSSNLVGPNLAQENEILKHKLFDLQTEAYGEMKRMTEALHRKDEEIRALQQDKAFLQEQLEELQKSLNPARNHLDADLDQSNQKETPNEPNQAQGAQIYQEEANLKAIAANNPAALESQNDDDLTKLAMALALSLVAWQRVKHKQIEAIAVERFTEHNALLQLSKQGVQNHPKFSKYAGGLDLLLLKIQNHNSFKEWVRKYQWAGGNSDYPADESWNDSKHNQWLEELKQTEMDFEGILIQRRNGTK